MTTVGNTLNLLIYALLDCPGIALYTVIVVYRKKSPRAS